MEHSFSSKGAVLFMMMLLLVLLVQSLLHGVQGEYGVCIPYQELVPGQFTYCDTYYTAGVDHFYLPNNRADGSINILNEFVAGGKFTIDVLNEPCQDTAIRLLCYHYYPLCTVYNDTHFTAPASICEDTCEFSVDIICSDEYQWLLQYINAIQGVLDLYNLHYPNCSDPFLPLRPFGQSCCSNVGVQEGVVISIERPEYTVYEEDQYVQICVEQLEGIIKRTILVTIRTFMLMAGDDQDYTEVEEILSFTFNVTRLCITVTITDDDEYEEQNKVFGVTLSSTDPVVSYHTKNATITIISLDFNTTLVEQPATVVIIASSITAGIMLLILIVAVGAGVWLKIKQIHTPL